MTTGTPLLRARAEGVRAGHPAAARLRVALTATTLTAATAAAVRPVTDLSPWLHLRVGQFLAGGGRFALPDPFAVDAARAYEPTQWLPSVAAYALVDRVGLPGIAWLRATAILALVVTLVIMGRRHLVPWLALVTAGVVTALCLPTMTERPQALGIVLLAVTVRGWWLSLEDGRPRWWLVPLAWVFASSHGLWSLGLVVGAVCLVGRLLDGAPRTEVGRLGLVLLAQLAASAATPLGPRLLVTPFTVGSNGRQFVEEWQPGTVAAPATMGVIGLAGIVAVVALARGIRMPRSRLLVVVVAVGLSAAAVRTGAVGVVVLTPVVVEVLAQVRPVRTGHCLPLGGLLGAAVVAALVAVPVSLARAESPLGVPTRLAPQLAALPAGTPVLSQTDVSGWLLWSAPHVSPVVDLRAESYTPAQMSAYLTTYQARDGWQTLVDSSRTRYALLEDDSALVGALEETRHWSVLGADAGYVLLGAPS